MVISFEEKDKAVIEENGMTVIEFKRILYNRTELYNLVKDLTEKIVKAWNFFKDKLLEALDDMRLLFEEIREAHHYPVSLRYKFTKALSRCTGIERRKIWKIARHTWLARSYC